MLEDKVYRVVNLPQKTLYQVYIPSSLRQQLLQHYHDGPLSGHLERYKTYERLQAFVYWPKMSLYVRSHGQCCKVCQLYKPKTWKPAGKLQHTAIAGPWEMLWVDVMGPFPQVPVETSIYWFSLTPFQDGLSFSPLQSNCRDSMPYSYQGDSETLACSDFHPFGPRLPVCVTCV